MQDCDRTNQLNISHLFLQSSSPHQVDFNYGKRTNSLNAQIDQKSAPIKSLSPDLSLISQLFEAQAKKHLVEAQVLTRDINKIEKLLFHLEIHWQELEKLTYEQEGFWDIFLYLELMTTKTQQYLVTLKQKINFIVTIILNLKHSLKLAKTASEYCKHRAEQEQRAGDKNRALASLVRQKTYLNTAVILKFSLKQQLPQLEILKYYLFILDSWLVLAKEIKHTLQTPNCGDSTVLAQSLLRQRIEIPDNTRHLRRELAWMKQEGLLFSDTNMTP